MDTLLHVFTWAFGCRRILTLNSFKRNVKSQDPMSLRKADKKKLFPTCEPCESLTTHPENQRNLKLPGGSYEYYRKLSSNFKNRHSFYSLRKRKTGGDFHENDASYRQTFNCMGKAVKFHARWKQPFC